MNQYIKWSMLLWGPVFGGFLWYVTDCAIFLFVSSSINFKFCMVFSHMIQSMFLRKNVFIPIFMILWASLVKGSNTSASADDLNLPNKQVYSGCWLRLWFKHQWRQLVFSLFLHHISCYTVKQRWHVPYLRGWKVYNNFFFILDMFIQSWF